MKQLLLPNSVKAAGDPRLERQIVGDGQTRHQIKLLEDDSQGFPAQRGAFGLAKLSDRAAIQEYFAGVRLIERADEMEQGALAAA